jgi:multidrug efflux pump
VARRPALDYRDGNNGGSAALVISELSIQRPVMAFVLSATLMVLGVLGFQALPVREIPRIDSPVVSVITNYPGASAEVVDNEITEKIERGVAAVSGIKTIRSRSLEGTSSINIEFELSRDLETAANDVRDRVARILPVLPDTIDPPQIFKVDSDTSPVMLLTVSSDRMSRLELTDYVRRYLVDPFSAVDGVAQVQLPDAREYAMRIWLDRNAMAARRITVGDVEAALKRENNEFPAGRIESGKREFTVRTDTRLVTADQFARIVLKRDGGNLIRLADVAQVEVAARDVRGDFRVNGKTGSVGIAISRQSTANTLDVANGLNKVLNQIERSLPPGTTINRQRDDSTFIRQSIREVFIAILFAVALVVIVIWAFLRTLRATIIPVVAIPVSLISAMAVLAALGFSLNVLTLLAFVLAVGLVVDDAIIVVENAMRRIEGGEPPLLAAYRGSAQIGFAVIATTVVLVAVVAPLAALSGTQGRLLREFAVALIAALVFSCLLALTLSPMLCSKLLRRAQGHGRAFEASERAFTKIADTYASLLDRALAAPRLVLASLAGAIALAIVLFLSLPRELTPSEDRGYAQIQITGPEGATVDYMRSDLEIIERIVKPHLDRGELSFMLGVINPGFGGPTSVNRGFLMMQMAPWGQRDKTIQQLIAEIRPQVMAVPGVRTNPTMPSSLQTGGSGGGSPIQLQFVIGGNTFVELALWRDTLMERLSEYRGLAGVFGNYDETKPQLRIAIDRERAADLGVGIDDIGATLETMMGGRQVTRFLDRGEEYDVMLQAKDQERANPRDLSNIYVRGTGSQQLIPLANLIRVVDVAGATELNRYNRLRSITFTGNLTEGTSMGKAIDDVRVLVAEVLPPEARLSFEGTAKQQLEASQSIVFAFTLALLAAFLALSAQFENFRLPGIILLAAPLAIFGGILTITLSGRSLNVYTEIGLIMLVGLIAKNAILIVEFANQLREKGASLDEAVREAARIRLRPILMTSIATVFGALPLAISTGAGSEARQAIGWVVAGGVTLGTAFSLFVTPVLYRLLARNVQPIGTVRRQIQRLETEHGAEQAAE